MKVRKEELSKIAEEVLKLASVARSDLVGRPNLPNKAVIIALQGDLGAGKTTFTQTLARELGIHEAVQSPTYVLMKSYPIVGGSASHHGFTRFIHIDAYRLEKPEEFSALKPETFLNDPENLVVIEWPERVEGILPRPDLVINFKHTDSEEVRHIEIRK